MSLFAQARMNMIEGQIRPNKVTDSRIVDAMAVVPREKFLPEAQRGFAYIDEDIACAPGRHLIEPMVLARLLQAASIGASDVVLDIGCGSGYSLAVISHLASTVVGIESDEALAARAQTLIGELEITNAAVVKGDLQRGYPEQAPYNVIVLAGAVSEVPQSLLGQLAEGGRLVTVVRKGLVGHAVLFERVGKNVSRRELFDAGTPIVPGFEAKPAFVF
ncbi:protein-L-isoaspartate O-methyltransferase family protein [Radicibacter daui]|uniref:protein-L-isoaspartate O-methyltransferase family protein n=1 Tax=Radicibacter daui TaxID=3064829 RepID=UPI004046F39E